jgi:predicted protein tyrosine phosphatase
MIKRVYAISYSRMKEFIAEDPKALDKHGFVSIIDQRGIRIFDEDKPSVITLFFDDVRPNSAFLERDEVPVTLFAWEHAERIIEFLVEFHARPTEDILYVNCGAGVSRSGAVITFVRDLYDLDHVQFDADNPQIFPNSWILETLEKCWKERAKHSK